jgi:Cd2+/Zn2+-exporting ATPase/Cu+-exporting ATPase
MPGVSESEVLATAAIAEKRSEHPLARAILAKASGALVEPERFAYRPGLGIVCASAGQEIVVGKRDLLAQSGVALEGCPAAADELTEVVVARAGRLLGAIHVADVLRPEAVEAVTKLRAMGLRTLLLTGDSEAIGQAVGKQLGVDEVNAGMLPTQKLERVRALMSDGRRVAMVGDGVNDAPALMQATVGIAMGSGTDVARESANVVLIGNDLLKLVETLQIARRCRRIIMQNFAGTLIVDGAGVGLAAFGLLNPLLAAFIHVSSELAFILNSTRLLPRLAARTDSPKSAERAAAELTTVRTG